MGGGAAGGGACGDVAGQLTFPHADLFGSILPSQPDSADGAIQANPDDFVQTDLSACTAQAGAPESI